MNIVLVDAEVRGATCIHFMKKTHSMYITSCTSYIL